MLLVSYATLLWAAFLQWTAASPVEWQGAAPLVKPFANARYKRQAQTSIPAPQPPPPEAYATAMPGLSPISDYRQQKYLDPSKDTEWWYYTGADGGQPGSIRMKLNAQVPAVALDHSTWITDVSCSGSVIITGKFTRTTAYDYAVKQWSNKKDVHFVSAAATCSPDGQNAWFAVQGLTFDEKSQTFTAQCTPTTIQDVWSNMNLDFGPNMNMQGIGMTGLPPRPESTSTFKEPIKGTATALTTPTANGYGAPTESPTAQIIRGLPAVAAGAGFDQRLDDRLAYYYAGGNVSEQVSPKISFAKVRSPLMHTLLLGCIGNGFRYQHHESLPRQTRRLRLLRRSRSGYHQYCSQLRKCPPQYRRGCHQCSKASSDCRCRCG